MTDGRFYDNGSTFLKAFGIVTTESERPPSCSNHPNTPVSLTEDGQPQEVQEGATSTALVWSGARDLRGYRCTPSEQAFAVYVCVHRILAVRAAIASECVSLRMRTDKVSMATLSRVRVRPRRDPRTCRGSQPRLPGPARLWGRSRGPPPANRGETVDFFPNFDKLLLSPL